MKWKLYMKVYMKWKYGESSARHLNVRTEGYGFAHQFPSVFTAPMINVMGPEGPALVHHPWTDADMQSAYITCQTAKPPGLSSGQPSKTFAESSCPLCLSSDTCSWSRWARPTTLGKEQRVTEMSDCWTGNWSSKPGSYGHVKGHLLQTETRRASKGLLQQTA